MKCRDCPYGKEDFERRVSWYQKIVNEQGIPNDIYGSETYEDAAEDAEQFLWCDKVGGKVNCFGHCTDALDEHYVKSHKINKNTSNVNNNGHYDKQKRRNKRNRDSKYKKHIKFLAQSIPYYPSPAMPVDENRRYNFNDPVGTVYYRRIYKGNHKKNRYKFYKKYANRVVRRHKGEVSNGCFYKKCFDRYWW